MTLGSVANLGDLGPKCRKICMEILGWFHLSQLDEVQTKTPSGYSKSSFVIYGYICTQDQHLPYSHHPREESLQTPVSCHGSFKGKKKGCFSNLFSDLINTDIPGYQNFIRMPPFFFSVNNFRKSLEAGLILAIMLRHLLAVSLACWPNHHL